MKKLTTLLILGMLCFSAKAQPLANAKDQAAAIEIFVGGTFGKAKILPGADKLAIVQAVITFKQVSTKEVTKSDRKKFSFSGAGSTKYTAAVSSYLEITDSNLTDDDFQGITNHFYNYLQKTLKENNVDTVGWDKITATDFYKNGKEDKDKDNDEAQKAVTYVANNGNTMYGNKTIFAFGKMKKANDFCEEINAPAVFINATVDFADIQIDLKASKSSGWSTSYYSVGGSSKATSKTVVAPYMKVEADGGNTLLWNTKSLSETVGVVEDIPAKVDFATEVEKDPSLEKKKFSFSFTTKVKSTPVVIKTTRAQYIAAAKVALEKYAEAIVAKIYNPK